MNHQQRRPSRFSSDPRPSATARTPDAVVGVCLVVALTVTACPVEPVPTFPDRKTKAAFDIDSDDFWARPLPSSLRIQDDGSSDVEKWPGPWDNELVAMWLRATGTKLNDGWGLSSGGFLRFDGAIDDSTLPSDPVASLDASVFLVDVTEGAESRGHLIPVRARVVPEDLYTPSNLIGITPVFGHLREGKHRYAFVVTEGVKDDGGAPLGASRQFFDALHNVEGADAALVDHLAPLAKFLDEKEIDLSTIASAAVFDTFDPNETILELSKFYEALPAPALTDGWTVAEEYETYQVLTGRIDVPVIQTGNRPYANAGEGLIDWEDDGTPRIKEMQSMRVVLTVPKSPQPDDGFPVMIYMHGSGGEWYQAINRGPEPEVPLEERMDPEPGTGPSEWLARRGVASLGFDFPLHGDRHSPPDTSGLVLYNLFGNIEATIDNFNVAASEVLVVSRFANLMTVDAALAATLDEGAAVDGVIRFNPDRLTAFGQSMGTTLGVAAGTVDPRIKGFVFSGAGGMLIEIAVTALEPVVLGPLIANFVELESDDLHIDHPLLHTFQALWDLVDPVVKAPYVSAKPHTGMEARHVFMSAGVRDGYFHPRSQAAVAVSLGATLVGDEVEDTMTNALALAKRETASFPLQSNLNGHTVGVVQYEAANTQGHYVLFNRDDARFQYTCFVSSIGVEAEPALVGPGALDAACP